ncbi:retrotransposon protein, putative, ty1-copia subclass [Tanacetum coccineum]
MHNTGKTIGELHAMLIEYEKGLPKKVETPQEKDKQFYIPKPKNPKPSTKEHPAKDDTCHHYKEVGHWKRNYPVYLVELLKKKKQAGTASSLACGIVQQLTPPYTPQHNEVSKRRNRTLLDMVSILWMNLTTLQSILFEDYASRVCNTHSQYRFESNKWIDAMNAEIQSMMDNMVWVLVDLPPSCKTVGKKYASFKDPFMVLSKHQEAGIKDLMRKSKGLDFIKILMSHVYIKRPSGKSVTFLILDLGEAAFILGIKIYRDRSKRLIRLGQSAYMDKILKRYKMDNSKRGHIPMQERLDLNKTQGASTPEEVKRMQNVPYASAVGSIMYAVRCTRPDVVFAQNITSRFQQNPGEPHWTAVENILKYLRNTKDMFLVFGENPKAELRVDCYYDVGFETDRDDIKS